MYKAIWDKLYTLIDWVKASAWVARVYNYELKQPEMFPYVTITPTSSTEEMYWAISNTASVPYNIAIYVQYKDNLNTQEQALRTAVDVILTTIRWDEYLTWSAMSSSYEVERSYSNDQEVLRIATIKAIYNLIMC